MCYRVESDVLLKKACVIDIFMKHELRRISGENFNLECQFFGQEWMIGHKCPMNLHEREVLPTHFIKLQL